MFLVSAVGSVGGMGRSSRRSGRWIELPEPVTLGPLSLEEALARRRSVRAFTRRQPTAGELSQLLWAAQGVTSPEGDRTAPSAGGLLPLELYLAVADGFYHYEPGSHRLRRLSTKDLRRLICRAALAQEVVREAPVTFVIAAVVQRTAARYGERRSPRYVHMEVGHAAQNLLLEAVALGLGAVVIGAFEDDELLAALSLPRGHQPFYLIPVGEPAAP